MFKESCDCAWAKKKNAINKNVFNYLIYYGSKFNALFRQTEYLY